MVGVGMGWLGTCGAVSGSAAAVTVDVVALGALLNTFNGSRRKRANFSLPNRFRTATSAFFYTVPKILLPIAYHFTSQ